MKRSLFQIIALLAISTGILSITTYAQYSQTVRVGKDGRFHIFKTVKVGDTKIKWGKYEVHHFEKGNYHVVVFTKVQLIHQFHITSESRNEVARIKCTVKPVSSPIKDTKLIIRRNAAGDREAVEVLIKGERVKHILLGGKNCNECISSALFTGN